MSVEHRFFPPQGQEILGDLLQLSREFIKTSREGLDYKQIAADLRRLTGARAVLVNRHQENGQGMKIMAVCACPEDLEVARTVLGEKLEEIQWPLQAAQIRKLKKKNFAILPGLEIALAGTSRENTGRLLDEKLKPGAVGILQVGEPETAQSSITIIMGPGEKIAHQEILELFAGHVELLMERAERERALRQSEAKFRLIFENAPLGLFHFNDQGRITACNERFVEIIGSSREQLLGLNMLKLPDERITGAIQDVLQGNSRRVEGDYRSFTAEKVTPARAFFAPLQSSQEDVAGAMGIVEDIGERRAAEKTLEEREARLQAILQTAPIGIGVDVGRIIQECNEYLGEMTGYEPGELIGQDVRVLYFDQEEYDRVGREKFALLEKTGRATLEALWRTKQGQPIEVLLNVTWLNPDNHREGSTFTALDVTDQNKNEKRLYFLSYHDPLTRVKNRTYLEEEMKRLEESGNYPISIIMADINGLKMINDAYGHRVGDQLLQRAADLMEACCGEKGIIARWGGDEFVFLLPTTEPQKAESMGQSLIASCMGVSVAGVPLSISWGISSSENEEKGLEEVLQEAEDQMYRHKLAEDRSVRSSVLSAILKTLGLKSDETEEHALRMQRMAFAMGEQLALSQDDLDRLILLVALHDIGKISIGEDILRKPGPLTSEEWEIVKKHPETGYRLAISTGEFAHIAEEILSHHEHWQGSGYPRELKKEKIPLLARIVSIIDAYDVMTNGRPYKEPMSREEALKELERCAGTQFDPRLVEIFVELQKKARKNEQAGR